MIYPVHIYGHNALRKKSENITADYPNLKAIIESMFETMLASDGIGLAAPQIGINIKLFIIDAFPISEDNPELADFKKVFINPIIIEESGEPWYYNEGCLSLPGIREDIKRKPIIKIEYFDEFFNKHIESFDGIKARIIQHEYDHLEGKLLIDHINPIKKQFLRKKLNNLTQGSTNVNYKVKFANSK